MKHFESLIEINPEKVKDLNEYIAYCKYFFKYKSEEKIKGYLSGQDIDKDKFDNLCKDFPFLKHDFDKDVNGGKFNVDLFKYLKKNKANNTFKDFPLSWLKDKIIKEDKYLQIDNKTINKLKKISGILESSEIKKYSSSLPKYSFIIWVKIELTAPYFSKDDDEFYIIQNPILKETNFKIPILRGSGLKGSMANAFKNPSESEENSGNRKIMIESFLRIFGTGSESIKCIENYLKKGKKFEEFKKKIVEFILFELGLDVDKKDIETINKAKSDKELFEEFLKDKISEKLEKSQNLPIEFQTHKGRAIFYPIYFDRLSLEIINPHDRIKRAGKNPIHYEIVPEGTKGILQIIYVPYDAVLKKNEEIEKEVCKDLKHLCEAVEKLATNGIGAKTKLGWGSFELKQKIYCVNADLKIENVPEGWKECQS
ncbi:hypothetical protein JYK00_01115 [Thermosipho ferrireducens]|uniref:CRISPR type III-associated protein domain-containing protein n=1 Tax=Thermosipho ferrireducens TaxID=2571116 RepID=A0ABX7S8Q6_9BACT|nr:RAMP superfamily CRISPR-associated protein [Thermosipho ferrireducens]QTA38170.1 hypothetical protein JYK00_01115 [Thermosipho ferrireducens]